MTKNTLEELSTKPNFIRLCLSIVIKTCFSSKIYAGHSEHQGVVQEIMRFSRVITNARAQADLKKIYFHGPPLQEQEFRLGIKVLKVNVYNNTVLFL